MSQTLDFSFLDTTSNTSTWASYVTGTVSTGDEFDPYEETSLHAAYGRLCILDGVTANKQFAYAATGSVMPTPLQMSAPSHPLMPLVGPPNPQGKIYGLGYKWRYRWKNSSSGDVSGLSPVPVEALNMGVVTVVGGSSVLGQSASFIIPTTDKPSYADTVQIFRNTSGQQDIYFLVGEFISPAHGATTPFIDNYTDDEIFTREFASLKVNPSFEQGLMPSVSKAYQHPTGRTFYYGIKKMGPYRTGSVDATAGNNYVTTSDALVSWTHARIGQSFRFLKTSGGSTIDDATVYRIVDVVEGASQKLYLYPDIKTTAQMSSSAYSAATYEIVDDRDPRAIYMSEPALPTNIDPLKTVYPGAAEDDAVLHLFNLHGTTYCQTRRHLYRIEDDFSEDPSLTMSFTSVAVEGTTGFLSGCVTPMGWVYLHPSLGVRVYDGYGGPRNALYGGINPSKPLGNVSEDNGNGTYQQFLPHDQFTGSSTICTLIDYSQLGFSQAMLDMARIYWDPVEHLVHVFYVPAGSTDIREELVFDPQNNDWRGPWRRRCTAGGYLANQSGDPIFVYGDDFGNLMIDNNGQSVDVLNGGTGAAATSTGGIGFVMQNSLAPFDATYYAQAGVPIFLTDPQYPVSGPDDKWLAYILEVVDTSTVIIERYLMSDSTYWTYRMGAVRWMLQTATLDLGEPIQPKKLERLRLRHRRGDTGSSGASVGALMDGVLTPDSAVAEVVDASTNAPVTTFSTTNLAWTDARIQRTGRLHSIVMYGTSTTGDPQITQVIADIDIRRGIQ